MKSRDISLNGISICSQVSKFLEIDLLTKYLISSSSFSSVVLGASYG